MAEAAFAPRTPSPPSQSRVDEGRRRGVADRGGGPALMERGTFFAAELPPHYDGGDVASGAGISGLSNTDISDTTGDAALTDTDGRLRIGVQAPGAGGPHRPVAGFTNPVSLAGSVLFLLAEVQTREIIVARHNPAPSRLDQAHTAYLKGSRHAHGLAALARFGPQPALVGTERAVS